jgi:putative membrane protein
MIAAHRNRRAAMFNGFHTMGAGDWGLMALLWVAVVALIVWLIVRLTAVAADGPGADDRRSETAREILDRRLARGEVDPETYEQLREQLDARPLASRR